MLARAGMLPRALVIGTSVYFVWRTARDLLVMPADTLSEISCSNLVAQKSRSRFPDNPELRLSSCVNESRKVGVPRCADRNIFIFSSLFLIKVDRLADQTAIRKVGPEQRLQLIECVPLIHGRAG